MDVGRSWTSVLHRALHSLQLLSQLLPTQATSPGRVTECGVNGANNCRRAECHYPTRRTGTLTCVQYSTRRFGLGAWLQKVWGSGEDTWCITGITHYRLRAQVLKCFSYKIAALERENAGHQPSGKWSSWQT